MCVCIYIKDKIIFIHSSIDRRLCFHILSIVNNATINVLQKTYSKHWASLVAQMIKKLPSVCETWVWSLGCEDPLEEGMATHCSILPWRIPMDRGAWWATVHGVQKESDITERLSRAQQTWERRCIFSVLFSFGYISSRIAGSCESFYYCFSEETVYCFPQWLCQFSFLLTVYQVPLFSTFLPILAISCLLEDSCFNRLGRYLLVALICISLIISTIEYLFFIYLLFIWDVFLGKNIYLVPMPILKLDHLLLLSYWVVWVSWASLVAQLVRNLPALHERPGFDPWIKKIPWRRERLPTPVYWPGVFHGLYSPWVCKELDTTEWL